MSISEGYRNLASASARGSSPTSTSHHSLMPPRPGPPPRKPPGKTPQPHHRKSTVTNIDAACNRLLQTFPEHPYILTVPCDPQYVHHTRQDAEAWLQNAPFQRGEESRQYVSFLWRDISDSCFIIRTEVDEERDRRLKEAKMSGKPTSTAVTPVIAASGAKKKLTLSAYKNKLANAKNTPEVTAQKGSAVSKINGTVQDAKETTKGSKADSNPDRPHKDILPVTGPGTQAPSSRSERYISDVKKEVAKQPAASVKRREETTSGVTAPKNERNFSVGEKRKDIDGTSGIDTRPSKKPRSSAGSQPSESGTTTFRATQFSQASLSRHDPPGAASKKEPSVSDGSRRKNKRTASPPSSPPGIPHGLPPLLSPIATSTLNMIPYDLPPMISPTLPPTIEAALSKQKRKRADSVESALSEKRLKTSQSDLAPRDRGKGVAKRPSPEPENALEQDSSYLNGVKKVQSTKSLTVRLKYGKRRRRDVERILRLPPSGRKQQSVSETTHASKLSRSQPRLQEPISLKPTSTKAGKAIAAVKPAAGKEPAKSNLSNKTLSAADISPSPEKQRKRAASPSLQKTPEQRFQASVDATPDSALPASRRRHTSASSHNPATPRPPVTPQATSARSSNRVQMDRLSLQQLSNEYNTLGRQLKHEAQAILQSSNQETAPERRTTNQCHGLFLYLESVMAYMIAFSYSDARATLTNAPFDFSLWKTLPPYFDQVLYHASRCNDKLIKGFAATLGVAMTSHVLHIITSNVRRGGSLAAPPTPANGTASASNAPTPSSHGGTTTNGMHADHAPPPTPDLARTIADHYHRLTSLSDQMHKCFPSTTRINELLPTTWRSRTSYTAAAADTGSEGAAGAAGAVAPEASHRDRDLHCLAAVAQDPEKKESCLKGPFSLPIDVSSSPLEAVRFVRNGMREYAGSAGNGGLGQRWNARV